jgi:hypothetical protein
LGSRSSRVDWQSQHAQLVSRRPAPHLIRSVHTGNRAGCSPAHQNKKNKKKKKKKKKKKQKKKSNGHGAIEGRQKLGLRMNKMHCCAPPCSFCAAGADSFQDCALKHCGEGSAAGVELALSGFARLLRDLLNLAPEAGLLVVLDDMRRDPDLAIPVHKPHCLRCNGIGAPKPGDPEVSTLSAHQQRTDPPFWSHRAHSLAALAGRLCPDGRTRTSAGRHDLGTRAPESTSTRSQISFPAAERRLYGRFGPIRAADPLPAN